MKMNWKHFLGTKNLTKAQFAAKSVDEMDSLLEEFHALKDAEIEALIAAKGSKEEVEAAKETLRIMKEEHVSLMAKIKALEENPSKQKEEGHASMYDALKAAFDEKAEVIKTIVANGGHQEAALRIELKTVGTMSVESTIGAGSTQVSITQNTGIISPIRKRELRYLANVSVGRIGTNRAMWIEETDEEGTPIMLGEGDAKTQLDVQYVEQTIAVKKIAVYGKVTTELMADIPQLISYIQNNLMKRMDIVLENQLFSGSGVGDNLKGLYEFDTAFSAGDLADSIIDANEIDVLEAVALQVETAFGMPNAIFVHPSTMAKMKLIKDEAGRPIWKDYVTISGEMVISGMRVITTTAITAGNFIGGDLTAVNVLIREDMGIQIGLDGNDFTQNKKTMLLEKRLVQFVSANDTQVIVSGSFATAKEALLYAPAEP
jgi:HK97 family phage major capsid protein